MRRAALFLLALQGAERLVAAGDKRPPQPTPPRFGGQPVKDSFKVWLSSWRNLYAEPSSDEVPLLKDSELPKEFAGVQPKVVRSAGGFAGGVVSEGMGYAMMVEGMMAAQGDGWAKELALGLLRSWLGMAQGDNHDPDLALGGASEPDGSAEKVDSLPYGQSAIKGNGPAGVVTWKFPRHLCAANDPWKPCHGSAADGDVDAVLGAIYLAGALGYPEGLVDIAVRLIITFASADLGFPDMYRTLPDGKRVFVPKAGSQWGGLTPPGGRFKTLGPEWCYNPAYFAPAHYRTFKKFLAQVWEDRFDAYLPHHLDGTPSKLSEIVAAFDGAILAGYNILYYSSCDSGTVSNWVGVMAACESDEDLSCGGVPWQYTPFVGKDQGQCSTSGTRWGTFGADAGRTFWRLAMDYVLHTEDSEHVDIYWRSGWVNGNITFNARLFLNRVVTQYRRYAECDGSVVGGCDCHYPGCVENATQAIKLAAAFAVDRWPRTPGLTCDNVPHHGQAWWAGFMAYPTFTAFVAPYDITLDFPQENNTLTPLSEIQQRTWMDTFAHICNFSNFTEEGGWQIFGKVCQTTYFHVSQETISTMLMSGTMKPLPEFHGIKRSPSSAASKTESEKHPDDNDAKTASGRADGAKAPEESATRKGTEKAADAKDGDFAAALIVEAFQVQSSSQLRPPPGSTDWLAKSVAIIAASVMVVGSIPAIMKLRRTKPASSSRTWEQEQGPLMELGAADVDGERPAC